MLCSVREANIAVFIPVVLFCIANLWPNLLTEAALPPGAEDELVLIEHLPGRRVHLQDFFWSGAEDAPPWLDPDQTLRLYESRTIHHTATVYLPGDGSGDSGDSGCLNCIEPTPTLTDPDQDIGVLIGDDPGPRYWLLTVLRAGETVPPRVELRLARLYKAAFSRQQRKHLGLLTTSSRGKRAARNLARRRKRENHRVKVMESQLRAPIASKSIIESSADEETTTPTNIFTAKTMRAVKIDRKNDNDSQINANDELSGSSKEMLATTLDEDFRKISSNASEQTTKPLHSLLSLSKKVWENEKNSEILNATQAKLRTLDVGKVQVRMQNTSVTEDGGTRLIYSVHLGGEPVPAASAARDMALLSEQEVALELGAPVIIQSEPYLKETRPLALSRRRDAWLLISAAAAGLMLLIFILVGLILAAKRKKARSAVAAPPPQSILKRQREYTSTTPGLDNTGYTSETEPRTEGTSQRETPGSRQRSPFSPGTPDTVAADIRDDLSEDEAELKRARATTTTWDEEEYTDIASKRQRQTRRRVFRTNAVDTSPNLDLMDEDVDASKTLENGDAQRIDVSKEEPTTSPHSYLSMPSCKQFPKIRSVEPLSRVLEPVVVRHLDLELDSPEMLRKHDNFETADNRSYLVRSSSVINDPGVLGPIVWDLRRQKAIEETGCSETDTERIPTTGPVGRARRRLHELLEDSFSLFGSRDTKAKESTPQKPPANLPSPKYVKMPAENRGKSANVSPVATPTAETKTRPRTSLPRRGFGEATIATENSGPHPRGAWGSRPLSAGPFHRPNLPEVDTVRILSDSRLPPEDPAVPLIAAIKKELEKFTPNPA